MSALHLIQTVERRSGRGQQIAAKLMADQKLAESIDHGIRERYETGVD